MHRKLFVLHWVAVLDSRSSGIDPGPDVEWYDVDYPEVATFAGSSTRPAITTRDVGLGHRPALVRRHSADRPILMVGEGLTCT